MSKSKFIPVKEPLKSLVPLGRTYKSIRDYVRLGSRSVNTDIVFQNRNRVVLSEEPKEDQGRWGPQEVTLQKLKSGRWQVTRIDNTDDAGSVLKLVDGKPWEKLT